MRLGWAGSFVFRCHMNLRLLVSANSEIGWRPTTRLGDHSVNIHVTLTWGAQLCESEDEHQHRNTDESNAGGSTEAGMGVHVKQQSLLFRQIRWAILGVGGVNIVPYLFDALPVFI